jgi:carbamate kinase
VTRTAVVALGGNALSVQGQRGTYDEQRDNASAMVVPICGLLDEGWRVVVLDGNSPKVGNLAIQQELGRDEVPEIREGGRVAVITSSGLVLATLRSDEASDETLGTRITGVARPSGVQA